MKKLFLIATIAMGLVTTSCDSYLDINQNPNSPQESDMTPSILMPAAEMSLNCSQYYKGKRGVGLISGSYHAACVRFSGFS